MRAGAGACRTVGARQSGGGSGACRGRGRRRRRRAANAAKAEREKAELRDQLRQQLNQILETRETARGLIVNLSDVLFDTGSANLKAGRAGEARKGRRHPPRPTAA